MDIKDPESAAPIRPYRPREYAEKYRLGANLVYAGMKAGQIPSIRIGNNFYIPRGAGDRLMLEGSGQK